MGARGPKERPPQLHVLRGNPSKKPLASLLDDVVRPDVEIPEAPAHLAGEALAEWHRITPHLHKLGLVSQIDRAPLVIYCELWGEYVEVCELIAQLRRRLKDHAELKATGLTAEARAWFASHVAKTPSGYQQISIPIQHRNKLIEQMKAYLAMFGMSPADRSRVTQSDPQLGLPGVDEKPKASGWGGFQ